MARVTLLRKAPIVEAIVEFQVAPGPETTLSDAERAHSQFKADYPELATIHAGSFEFHLGAADSLPAPTSLTQDVGKRYISIDHKKIVDFNLPGFSFHLLAPYTEWADLRAEAKRLWAIYVSAMKPQAITRIGVRFINNLAIPQSASDLCDYLVPGPIVPDGLPQSLRSFLSRIEIADDANNRIGIVGQSLQGLTSDGNLSVLLDIDVIRNGAFAPSDENIWDIADGMRDFKNEIFFRSVTDKLLEQYK